MFGNATERNRQSDSSRSRPLTIVIKLGTSSICDEKTHEPLLSNLSLLVETSVRLRREGHRVILVSSGAIGIGLRRLDLDKRPKHLAAVQAIAAVGQCRLIALWDELFKQLRQPVAQILLTRNDIADRTQYLNAANTFAELLNMGIIPIVNENDTLAVNEIKFGDNDTLSAITAGMVNADYLFLMTDVDCLYTSNPRTNADALPIEVVEDISSLDADVSTAGSALGTGGMSTKLTAARLATSAGVTTIITKSSTPSNIFHIVSYIQSLKSHDNNPSFGLTVAATSDATTTLSASDAPPPSAPSAPLHTRFLPKPRALRDRYFWILHGLKPHGTLFIDEGAYRAITRTSKAGLLPVGVVDVHGAFAQQECVALSVARRLPRGNNADSNNADNNNNNNNNNNADNDTDNNADDGEEKKSEGKGSAYEVIANDVGRALVNYSSAEIARIMGKQSTRIEELIGYADSEYVAYRDNTAFFDSTIAAARS